jgi:multiple sugar transport system ATP-binding protein
VRIGGSGVCFDARVEVVEYLGDEQLVHLMRKDVPVLAKLGVEDRLQHGTDVTFSVPPEKLYLFDAETEERIRT